MVVLFILFYLIKLDHTYALSNINNKMSFWAHSQKGANIFSRNVNREDIRAAKNYGIKFIRLAPDKLIATQKDFLIGNADHYTILVPKDVAILKQILDMCFEEEMPVVITMVSLPGSRWLQHNNSQDDLRIWINAQFTNQAIKFWTDMAIAFKDHPAIIGYNILNEPHPERLYDKTSTHIANTKQIEVQKLLFNFYKNIITAIRTVDSQVPIIIDSSAYGEPKAFKHFIPQDDKYIIYSFHMYEPYSYTNKKVNNQRFNYPGLIDKEYWDKNKLIEYMSEVNLFQQKHKIPSNRILVGEYGGHRTTKGITNYFKDLIEIFKLNEWHFAFYAFREDTWDGMDYELGNKKLPGKYWQDLEQGRTPILNRNEDYEPFKIIKDELKN